VADRSDDESDADIREHAFRVKISYGMPVKGKKRGKFDY
jgi:hypothetical protein